MAVIVEPDIGAALMLFLKDCTALYTDVGSPPNSRIFLEWPKSSNNIVVPPYINCILIETGKGGPGRVGSALIKQRVDIKYYGANRKTANDIYRIGNSYLVPIDERIKSNFIKANCRVHYLETEGTGLRLIDPDASNWPYTLGTYIVTYSGIPVV